VVAGHLRFRERADPHLHCVRPLLRHLPAATVFFQVILGKSFLGKSCFGEKLFGEKSFSPFRGKVVFPILGISRFGGKLFGERPFVEKT
jgi:hypothetical protein